MTRNGKIARLPADIREELNRRLERNIPGITLVAWLNSLPEVQAVLRELFDGNPVIPQNLSQWRQGGFAEWQARKDLLERACDAGIAAGKLEETCGHMAERAAQLLAARFAIALAEWDTGAYTPLPIEEDPDPAPRDSPPSVPSTVSGLKPLFPLARAIAQLRRGDRESARLKMDQYRFERLRRQHETSDARGAGARQAREDTAASLAAVLASAFSPPGPPAVAARPAAANTRSHPIKPVSARRPASRREQTRPKVVTTPATGTASTPSPPAPTSAPTSVSPFPTSLKPPAPVDPVFATPAWMIERARWCNINGSNPPPEILAYHAHYPPLPGSTPVSI